MKKIISILLCVTMLMATFAFDISATNETDNTPIILSFSLTGDFDETAANGNETRVSGLITSYGLSLEKSGTTLKIYGQTYGSVGVVRTGFKDLVIQRRASTSDSWKEYYDFGNLYIDMGAANLDTTLVVESGYQYRISCKHYAKKNLLSVQTIANTSNIVIV